MNKPDPADDTLLDELLLWGGPSEMGAFDAIMWRVEENPMLRSTGTIVFQLDRCPDWARLVAAHQWLVSAVPRFRQRVVDPSLGLGAPTWVDDPEFILDYHLRHIRLPAPGSERQLLDFIQNAAMSPFDKARAPWEATLVEGLEGGGAAYVLKVHHSTSDGLGFMQLLGRVLSTTAEPSGRAPPKLSRPAKKVPKPLDLAVRNVAKGVRGMTGSWIGLGGSALGKARDWLRDPKSFGESLDYAASAQRMLSVKPVPGSPLMRKRSLTWRADAFDFPLASIKAAAKAVDASLNDVLLAGIMGGFRRYHEEMGVATPKRMPISFPVSIRTDADPMGGNRFAGAQHAALIDETDSVKRIRDVQEFVRKLKSEPALDSLMRVMPVLTRLPVAVAGALTSGMTMSTDAQISNVPGLKSTVYLAGARVTHMWPFGPVPGCAMMIAMISYDGRCCLGLNSDRAAVTEPELLVRCLREGIDEVLELGSKSAAPGPGAAGKSVRNTKTSAGAP